MRLLLACAVMWGRVKSCVRLSTAQYKPPASLDKRVTNPLQVVNLPHAVRSCARKQAVQLTNFR